MCNLPSDFSWLAPTFSFYRDLLNQKEKSTLLTQFITSCSPLSPPSSSPYFTQILRVFIGPIYSYFMITSTFPCCSYDTTPLAFNNFCGVTSAALITGFLPTSNKRKLIYVSSALYQIWLSWKMIWLPNIGLFHWEICAKISGTQDGVRWQHLS